MTNYKVEYKKSAYKELFKLPKKEIKKITILITSLSENPRPDGCKKLKGYHDLWRIRSGNYRIVYSIEDKVLTIRVLQIVNRKDAY